MARRTKTAYSEFVEWVTHNYTDSDSYDEVAESLEDAKNSGRGAYHRGEWVTIYDALYNEFQGGELDTSGANDRTFGWVTFPRTAKRQSMSHFANWKRKHAGLVTDTLYVVEMRDGSESYAVSPDGAGLYWYDSEEEAEREHGHLSATVSATEDELDGYRHAKKHAGEDKPPAQCPKCGDVLLIEDHDEDPEMECSSCGWTRTSRRVAGDYDHWNEDARYVEHAERDRYSDEREYDDDPFWDEDEEDSLDWYETGQYDAENNKKERPESDFNDAVDYEDYIEGYNSIVHAEYGRSEPSLDM